MEERFLTKIKHAYNLEIDTIKPAPRSFVAETWFIETTSGKYFVKIIDKQLFIPEIMEGLPVLVAMHDAGIERINWPISTKNNELYLMQGNVLIVLYNYIDAEQSYDYSEAALGKLLAEIHAVTPKIKVKIPEENFKYAYKERFESQFAGILSGQLVKDDILNDLQSVLRKYEDRIGMQYRRLDELAQMMKQLNLPKVITHGDAGGNTLVKTPTDLFIIDWDGILLSPPERDMWVPTHIFLDGYREIMTDYEPNTTSLYFYTLMYYFRSMAQYFAEIISSKPIDHRKKNLLNMTDWLKDGWMNPYLKQAKAF